MQGLELEIKAGMVIVVFPQGQCGATSEMLTILTGFLVEITFACPRRTEKGNNILSYHAVTQV